MVSEETPSLRQQALDCISDAGNELHTEHRMYHLSRAQVLATLHLGDRMASLEKEVSRWRSDASMRELRQR